MSFNLNDHRELKFWLGIVFFISIDEDSEFILNLKFRDIEPQNLKCSPDQFKKVKDAVDYYLEFLSERNDSELDVQDFILKSDKSEKSHIDRSTFYRILKSKLHSLGLSGAYNLQSCRQFAKQNVISKAVFFKTSDFNEDDTVFHDNEEIKKYVEEVFRKKNVILQGPPGTGKSFVAKKISEIVTNNRDECLFQVQMHPSFHYEDFVQGYRPDETGSLKLVKGIFLDICERAFHNPDLNYVVLMEEINRCDLNQVFGELLHLIDSSKRSTSHGLRLMHHKSDETFSVPPNVFIVATMNTADRSTVNIDYAMKRRFSFLNIRPQFQSEKFQNHLINNGFTKQDINLIYETILKINLEIAASRHLGENFVLGHSYFCDSKKTISTIDWLRQKLEYEIQPILKDYWFDDQELVLKLTKGDSPIHREITI